MMAATNADQYARRRVRAHRDDDTSQLQALVEEGRALLNVSADPSAYQLDPAFAELSGRFAALQDAATQLVDAVSGRGGQTLRVVDDYVRARPWTATAEAAVLGFVVGWLISERL